MTTIPPPYRVVPERGVRGGFAIVDATGRSVFAGSLAKWFADEICKQLNATARSFYATGHRQGVAETQQMELFAA